MPKKNSQPGFFRKLAARLRGDKGKLRRQFDSDLEEASKVLNSWKPYCTCAKQEHENLRKQLRRMPKELGSDLLKSRRDESEALLSSAVQKIAACTARFNETKARDIRWRSLADSISGKANDLRVASSVFPGREFAKDVDNRTHHIESIARKEVPAAKQSAKVEEKLQQAENKLGDLRHLIAQAEELAGCEPALAEAVASIAAMGVEQDVACAQKYQTLIRMQREIQSCIRKSSYAAGHWKLIEARKICNSVRQDIEKRDEIARLEIDLWLDDAEICVRFDLQAFPRRLTPAQAQGWRDIRLEIEEFVVVRAERARLAYSRMDPAKRNLRFSLKQLEDWDNLAAFARSAKINSTYRSPRFAVSASSAGSEPGQ
jgi:hypothetical protein